MASIVRRVTSTGLLFASALVAAACGGSGASATGSVADASGPDTSPSSGSILDGDVGDAPASADAGDAGMAAGALPIGAPITVAAGAWTWVDFPDSVCDDGTPTGIGVYRNTASDKLFVYFNGGGACWDYSTCAVLNTSVHGPFGAAQFAAFATGTPADNSVFVPYCTGDLHAGDAVTTYTGGDGGSRTVHHKGHANVLAYLARLAATFKAPSQIVVSGASAGGGGAVFNYPSFRAYWPAASMLLIDDSLPLLEGGGIPAALRAAWFQNWNLGALTMPICGAGCQGDLSLFMSAVAKKYPGDRMALLSSEQDQTIASYFQLTGMALQTDLMSLATDVLDPLPNFKHFYVAGSTHTMLGSPANFTAAGTPLPTWLAQMAAGDPAWTSAGP